MFLRSMMCLFLPGVCFGAVVPANPTAFEQVVFRVPHELYEVSPCVGSIFLEKTVIQMTGSALSVRIYPDPEPISIGIPPPEQCADFLVPLGRFPKGDFVLTVYLDDAEETAASYSFSVENPYEGQADRPLQDYSGVWWSSRQSGGALMIQQSVHGQFGAFWMTHDAEGSPTWYWVALGEWLGPGEYTGPLLRTLGGAPPDWPGNETATPGTTLPIGEARLYFGDGRNDYFLNFHYRFQEGEWRSRFLQRFPF